MYNQAAAVKTEPSVMDPEQSLLAEERNRINDQCDLTERNRTLSQKLALKRNLPFEQTHIPQRFFKSETTPLLPQCTSSQYFASFNPSCDHNEVLSPRYASYVLTNLANGQGRDQESLNTPLMTEFDEKKELSLLCDGSNANADQSKLNSQCVDKERIETCYPLQERLKLVTDLHHINPLGSKLLEIETILAHNLVMLEYGTKVSHVYNPVDYAFKPHFEYYRKYCLDTARVVMVGMNPGPFGMAQSGVPFGDVKSVRDWLNISNQVGSPRKLNRKRPILGFDCKRTEVSGSRLWTFLEEQFVTPENFFSKVFIYNHCPLVFMGQSGVNITPAQMPASVRHSLNELSDEALVKSIRLFENCDTLIGIGRFAEDRIKHVCKKYSLPHGQGYLMHPSPRNPTANKEWRQQAITSLERIGLIPKKENANESVDQTSSNSVKKKLFNTFL